MYQRVLSALLLLFFSASAQASQKLDITPFCYANDTQLTFFTVVDMDINRKGEKSKDRWLYKATCYLPTSTCSGVVIKLKNLEAGREVDMLDIILPELLVINRTKNVFTLGSGPFVTLIVDLTANRIDYRESAPDFENYGVGYCSKVMSKKLM